MTDASKKILCRLCGSDNVAPYRARAYVFWCNACYNAWRREKYKAKPHVYYGSRATAASRRAAMLDPVKAQKVRARALIRNAIWRGNLVRQPCEVCGMEPAEAHHDDYSRPRDIRWLCADHHREHHAKVKADAAKASPDGVSARKGAGL